MTWPSLPKSTATCAFVVALAFGVSFSAGAATLAGVHFDDTLMLDGQALKLNGLGIRGVLFIHGYVAGLYVTQTSHTLKSITALPGPKRLQLHMLHSASAKDFITAMEDGIRENSSAADLTGLKQRMTTLKKAIEAFGSTKPGDVIQFDYLPDKGTTLTVNGATKGDAIAGADFYSAVLKVFMGQRPVDDKLKAGLLSK